ncbi:hypothetical protein BC940DRAFT_297408 [Gongronella butleri]|nr:hypothetical protein BC940DRAFT_297408 [Gongronella butleri]
MVNMKNLGLGVASMALMQQVAASGIIAQVVDATDFCMFLPPPGITGLPLSDNEWDAVSYCMGNTPKATGAEKMPDGFVLSAHYVATDAYVQVTGQINPTKAGLLASDEGGQCDVAAPQGSSCAGWQYYVNLIEPANNIYCMRCCNDQTNCNRGISQDGCARVVPGDYSGPLTGGAGLPTTTSTPSGGSSSVSASVSASSSVSVVSSVAPLSSSVAPPSSAAAQASSGASGANSGSTSQQSVSAQSVNGANSLLSAKTVAGSALMAVALAFTL